MPTLARPDSVLGSRRATLLAASFLTAVVVSPAVFLTGRVSPGVLALAVGGTHGASLLVVWFGTGYVTGRLQTYLSRRPRFLIGMASSAWLVLGALAAVPTYLLARWSLLAPFVVLVPVTWLLTISFLLVDGETDAIGLYTFYGPLVVAALVLLGGVEFVLRHGLATW